MGGPDPLQPLPAPREVARQPRPERHQREEQGEQGGDDQDEPLQVGAELRQRRPGAGKGVPDDIADALADERDPRQRLPEVAPALDHRLAAGVDRPAGLREARQELEQLPGDVPPEHRPTRAWRGRRPAPSTARPASRSRSWSWWASHRLQNGMRPILRTTATSPRPLITMRPVIDPLLLAAFFFVAALLYASVGHAGASAYLAIMALSGVSPDVARPTALALNIVVASLVSYRFWRAGHISWRALAPFLLGSIPLAFFGGSLPVAPGLYKKLVGRRSHARRRRHGPDRPPRRPGGHRAALNPTPPRSRRSGSAPPSACCRG